MAAGALAVAGLAVAAPVDQELVVDEVGVGEGGGDAGRRGIGDRRLDERHRARVTALADLARHLGGHELGTETEVRRTGVEVPQLAEPPVEPPLRGFVAPLVVAHVAELATEAHPPQAVAVAEPSGLPVRGDRALVAPAELPDVAQPLGHVRLRIAGHGVDVPGGVERPLVERRRLHRGAVALRPLARQARVVPRAFEASGAVEVDGQELGQSVGLRGRLLEDVSGPVVHLSAHSERQACVGDVTQEDVPEAQGAVVLLDEEVVEASGGQRHPIQRLVDHRRQGAQRHEAAEDGRVAQEGTIPNGQRVDGGGDQGLDRLGDVGEGAADRGVDQLLQEERVAAAAVDQVVDDPGREDRGAGRRHRQLHEVLAAQGGQRPSLDAELLG